MIDSMAQLHWKSSNFVRKSNVEDVSTRRLDGRLGRESDESEALPFREEILDHLKVRLLVCLVVVSLVKPEVRNRIRGFPHIHVVAKMVVLWLS